MIPEHELVEQIEHVPGGWPLERAFELLRSLGRADPALVLRRMCEAGLVALVDGSGAAGEPWRAQELLRGSSFGDTRVTATEEGSRAVHER